MPISGPAVAGVLLAVLVVAGCSSPTSPPAAVSSSVAEQVPGSAVLPSDEATGESGPGAVPADGSAASDPGIQSAGPTSAAPIEVPDPCLLLTKADVQPFFTVPIATALPSAAEGPQSKGCEWSDGSGGGVQTTIDVDIRVGDDAQTSLTLSQADAAAGVAVSGVGDHAFHPKGDPSLSAFKGSGADLEFCGITTFGIKELVPNQNLVPGHISDAQATVVAQQYGTLCNKIFGSGSTTPTMTAPAPTGSAASSPAGGPTVPVPADGGTMPNSTLPLPVGLDCSGGKTVKDELADADCTTTTKNPESVYAYYLAALPKHGYTINRQSEEHSGGQLLASINFSGSDAGLFSSISIRGDNVTILLRMG